MAAGTHSAACPAVALRLHRVTSMAPNSEVRVCSASLGSELAPLNATRSSTRPSSPHRADIRAVLHSIREHLASVENAIDDLPCEVQAQASVRLNVLEGRLARLSDTIGTLAHLSGKQPDANVSGGCAARRI